jgi:hypothetical protein
VGLLSYLQTGLPSPAEAATGLGVLMPIPQLNPAIVECVIVANQ